MDAAKGSRFRLKAFGFRLKAFGVRLQAFGVSLEQGSTECDVSAADTFDDMFDDT